MNQHIRERLQQACGNERQFHVSDSLWDYLVREGKVREVERGKKDIEWLREQVRDFWEASGTYQRRYRVEILNQKSTTFAERQQVLSLLLAEEANGDEDVISFRKRILKNRLLKQDQLEVWVKRQSRNDGTATAWLTIPLPPTSRIAIDTKTGQPSVKPALTISKNNSLMRLDREMLEYPVSGWVQSVPTAANGTLGRLRCLSERLASAYGWQKAQATAFVLTKGVPLIAQAKAMASTEARGRIVLDVDPAMTPRQVAESYRRFRKAILKGTRLRTLSEKHLRLAAFSAQVRDLSKADMRTWNRLNPNWRYEEEKLFRRDVSAARKRINTPIISIRTQLTALEKEHAK